MSGQDISVAFDGRVQKVIAALENPEHDWRTVAGVSKETGLSVLEVQAILNQLQETVIQYSIPDEQGRPLYTTRQHYGKRRGILNRILTAVTLTTK